jgi:hypothetical protein
MVMRGVTEGVFGGDLFYGGLARWVVKDHGLKCPFGGWSSLNSGAGVVCFSLMVRSEREVEGALLFLSIPGGTNAGCWISESKPLTFTSCPSYDVHVLDTTKFQISSCSA